MEIKTSNNPQILPKICGRDTMQRIILILFMVFLFSILSLYIYTGLEKDKVAAGTCINIGDKQIQDIDNYTYDNAVEMLNNTIDEYLKSTVTFNWQSETHETTLYDIGVAIDNKKPAAEIKKALYGCCLYDSLIKHFNHSKQVYAVQDITIDHHKLDNYIRSELSYIEKEPEEAQLIVNSDGELEIRKDSQGISLDREKLYSEILNAVKNNNLYISIPTKSIPSAVTEAHIRDLMPVKLISSYSSYYGGSDSGRKQNIRVGASRINNVLIKPGEEFEYWEYVGEPTADAGFKPAGIFLNGEVAAGIGGGLCQVSSTLYNAALLADLKIIKRSPHGMPVYYVPLGLDATVAYGSLTLRFVNNSDKYIFIKSNTDKNIITFSIYGDMPDNKAVKVYSKIVESNTADAYRDVYIDGKLTRRDYLGRSIYKSLPADEEQSTTGDT